ncbi:MAG: OsmC family peroxiredoxin [Crocinitomix sp.]|nr:OsmC family peroxiredoxin [Crocinitomix sp.]
MSDTVKATWHGNMHFTSESNEGVVNLDASEEFGGTDSGLRSKSLMLTSLAGCTGMDLGSLIKKMRIAVDGITIIVTAELTDQHPKIYKSTHIVYHFTGENLDREKLTKAVNLSVERYCGVIEMFRAFSEVTNAIKFN